MLVTQNSVLDHIHHLYVIPPFTSPFFGSFIELLFAHIGLCRSIVSVDCTIEFNFILIIFLCVDVNIKRNDVLIAFEICVYVLSTVLNI